MKSCLIMFWLVVLWSWPLGAQTSQDENHFSYHSYFCKGDSLPNLKKQERILKQSGKEPLKIWAARLSHAGLISYSDTFTKYIQHQADLLQPSHPIFKLRFGTIKSPKCGFISISKDLIYIYSGTYASIESDGQLNSILMLATVNHQRTFGKIKPEVALSGNRWVLLNMLQENDYREATLLSHQIFPNSGWGIPELSGASHPALKPIDRETLWLGKTDENKNFLSMIGKLTKIAMEFQDGRYDECIRLICQDKSPHNRYTMHLLLKCLYMKTLEMVQHPYFPKEQFHFFNPELAPISDKMYFRTLLYHVQQTTIRLHSDTARAILYQMMLLEQEFANLPQHSPSYQTTFDSDSFKNELSKDSGWLPFLNNLTQYSWYKSSDKIYNDSIPSARFLELLPDPANLKSNGVLIIHGEPLLSDTFTEAIRKKQWIRKERYTEFRLHKRAQRLMETLVQKSKYPKAYRTDYKILRHGDICRHTTEINEAGLQTPFVSWITRDADPEFNARNIRYIIYIQSSMLPGSRYMKTKHFLIRMGFPILKIYNKHLSGVDVYDIISGKYIFTSRRLIDYHGMDIYLGNLFDQLTPLIR